MAQLIFIGEPGQAGQMGAIGLKGEQGEKVTFSQMSLVATKSVYGVSDQFLHKPGCTATEDG